ncbi:MAG: tetratricopeptide repeat protein [candidate division KSB1 bacterium]|jgi:TolA-binding protein|nr:tetratricopeptide repeat protein [candidate division KSB1 bacterium]
MNDIKTVIRSSIISIIIVVIGLFILCVGRAPRVNVDEPLVESGTETDVDELSDEEFLQLLESADLGESDTQSTSESILLGDESKSAESEDEDLSEIFKILSMEEENTAGETEPAEDTEDLEALLFDSDTGSEDASSEVDPTAFNELQSEIDRVQLMIEEKDSEIATLNQEIYSFDQQIADLETNANFPGGGTSSDLDFSSGGTAEESGAVDQSWDNDTSPFRIEYNTALDLFHNRQYQQSKRAFQRLLYANPNHSMADNCQYWIGECNYAIGDYFQAILEFEKVFSYDAADKKDDAQIMIGLANLRAGLTDEARQDLSWFLTFYPNSEYYSRAQSYYSSL